MKTLFYICEKHLTKVEQEVLREKVLQIKTNLTLKENLYRKE